MLISSRPIWLISHLSFDTLTNMYETWGNLNGHMRESLCHFERSFSLNTPIRKLRVGFLKLPEIDSILLYLVWLKPHLSFAPRCWYVAGWEICRNYITGHMRVTPCHEYYNISHLSFDTLTNMYETWGNLNDHMRIIMSWTSLSNENAA
jgi:hypothetical protein